jgi:hypothetical protein
VCIRIAMAHRCCVELSTVTVATNTASNMGSEACLWRGSGIYKGFRWEQMTEIPTLRFLNSKNYSILLPLHFHLRTSTPQVWSNQLRIAELMPFWRIFFEMTNLAQHHLPLSPIWSMTLMSPITYFSAPRCLPNPLQSMRHNQTQLKYPMHDLLHSYGQFQTDQRSPTIPVMSLRAMVDVPPAGVQFMLPDSVVSVHYVRKFMTSGTRSAATFGIASRIEARQ